MQTEADKKIQAQLESAGRGLPALDAFFLRYISFPALKMILSWDMSMNLFEREGRKILNAVQPLGREALFKKVLVPKTFGIEDNSRYYSPAMILWHLIYVGKTIHDGIIRLSRNETMDIIVKIENFKPFVDISENIVSDYESFLGSYRTGIEENIKNKNIDNYLVHPWFGKLNPRGWLLLSALHQVIHGRQLRKILKIGA